MQSISSTLHDGGQKVFAHFGFDCTNDEKQSAPQLTGGDTKPSLSFKRQDSGDYVFSVWNTGAKGDCVKFVQLLLGCDASQAARYVRGIYDGTKQAPPSIATPSQMQTAVSIPKARTSLVNCDQTDISANEKACDYFRDKSGGYITADVLRFFGVSYLERYTTRNELTGECKEHDVRHTAEANPLICFDADVCDRQDKLVYLQVKAPFSTLEHKTWRYLSPKANERAEARSLLYTFGFKQLRKHHFFQADFEGTRCVYIAEGESDCIALNAIGFPSVTFGGGFAKLNEQHVKLLKGKKVTLVIVVCDADKAGQGFKAELDKQRDELLEKHGIRLFAVTPPKLSGDKGDKDVCDFLKKYGKDESLWYALTPFIDDDFQKELEAERKGGGGGDHDDDDDDDDDDDGGGNGGTPPNGPTSGDDEENKPRISLVSDETTASIPSHRASDERLYTRRGDSMTMKPVKVGKHVLEAYDEIVTALYKHKHVQLCAGTGKGKTFAAVEIARNIATGKMPFTEEELQELFGGNIPFTEPNFRTVVAVPTSLAALQIGKEGDCLGLCSLTELDETSLKRARTDSLVVTTYDSLHKCGDFDLLIVDEVHEISKAYSYRADAVSKVLKMMKEGKYVLALTATPEPIITKTLEFHTLQVETPNRQHLVITPQYMDEMQTAVSISKKGKEAKKDTKPKKAVMLDKVQSWCVDVVSRGGVAVVRHNSKDSLKALKKGLEAQGLQGVYTVDRTKKAMKDIEGKETVFGSIIEKSKLPDDCKVLLSTCVLDTAVNIRGKDIEVMIVCTDTKDADNVVQFAARFRDMETLKVRLLFTKRNKRTVYATTAFDEYERHKEEQGHGARWMNYLQSEGISGTLKTVKGKPLHDKLGLHFDKERGLFSVSEAWCLNKAISDRNEKTSEDLICELRSMTSACITQATFTDAITDAREGNVSVIHEALQAVKKENEELQAKVLELYTEQETAFVTAWYNVPHNDAKVKGMLVDRFSTMMLREDDASKGLYEEHKQAFHDPKTAKVLKNILQDLKEGFTKEDAVTLSKATAGSNSRTLFKALLRALQCFHGDAEGMRAEDKAYKEHLVKIASKFTTGERVTPDELRRRVVECGDVATMRIQEKHIVSLVRTLFKAERVGERKEWQIGEIETIEGFCAGFGVAPPCATPDTSPVYIL